MDDIIFSYYKAGIIVSWLTLPRSDFSTENFEEEIQKTMAKHAPKDHSYCIINTGWVFAPNGKNRKDIRCL